MACKFYISVLHRFWDFVDFLPKFKEVMYPWPCPFEGLFVSPKTNTSRSQPVYKIWSFSLNCLILRSIASCSKNEPCWAGFTHEQAAVLWMMKKHYSEAVWKQTGLQKLEATVLKRQLKLFGHSAECTKTCFRVLFLGRNYAFLWLSSIMKNVLFNIIIV